MVCVDNRSSVRDTEEYRGDIMYVIRKAVETNRNVVVATDQSKELPELDVTVVIDQDGVCSYSDAVESSRRDVGVSDRGDVDTHRDAVCDSPSLLGPSTRKKALTYTKDTYLIIIIMTFLFKKTD